MARVEEPTADDREGWSNPTDVLRIIICDCGARLEVTRYNSWAVDCRRCGASYNGSGSRLRDDWRGNPSLYDDEIGDLEGFEIQHANDE